MADYIEGDTIVHYLALMVVALMALIAGLVIHSFIIGVNVNDWWKGRSVTPVDHIVTSLAVSRMCAQCTDTLYVFVDRLCPKNLSLQVTLIILDAVYSFFAYANNWLTTLLSIVLCLKISNLHTRLFLYLRRMILHRTVQGIVALVIFSALNTLMPFSLTITEVTNSEAYNTTKDNRSINCIYMNSIYNVASGTFPSLLFYSISSVLLFSSLYHHTTRMKMSSNLSINLETYYSVMRFVSITFIYNTIYYICLFVCVFYYNFYCLTLHWLYVVVDFLPVLHSSYLIYRTAKLRNQMSKVLYNVISFLFHRKDTDTRENIEVVDV